MAVHELLVDHVHKAFLPPWDLSAPVRHPTTSSEDHPLEVPVLFPRLCEGNAKELTETPAALMPGPTAAAVEAVGAPHGSEMSHTHLHRCSIKL